MPTASLLGEFAITDAALSSAEALLPSFRGPEGDHEGIVYLLGYEVEDLTIYSAALAPEADHGPGHVICSAESISEVQRAARAHGHGVLAQVHTHPGQSSQHSIGDDDLVLMPFEGMLSIVVPWFGRFGLKPLDSLGVHQFQRGRWRLASRSSVHSQFRITPSKIDLR